MITNMTEKVLFDMFWTPCDDEEECLDVNRTLLQRLKTQTDMKKGLCMSMFL